MSYFIPLFMVNEIDPVFDEISRNNLIVFDVGANTGVWTKALLNHSDELIKRIYMFEPLKGNYDKILERKEAGFYQTNDGKLRIFNQGLSNEAATYMLNHEDKMSAFASIEVKSILMGPRAISLDMQTEIKCTTIEDICSLESINQIDFLKIDVEGHELKVLKGGENMIRNHKIKNIIFEFGTHQLFINQQFKVFWDFFEKYGYKMYLLRGGINGYGKVHIQNYSTKFEDYTRVRMFYASIENL